MFLYQLFPLLANVPEELKQRDWTASAVTDGKANSELLVNSVLMQSIFNSYLEVYNMGGLHIILHTLQNSSP